MIQCNLSSTTQFRPMRMRMRCRRLQVKQDWMSLMSFIIIMERSYHDSQYHDQMANIVHGLHLQ